MSTISVVIPCYNYGRYLNEAIESVLSQSRPPDEIVVVNDGSTDDTSAVVRRFSRVRLIEQDNQGVVRAKNRAIEEARSDYIFFLDADDTIDPTCLDKAERLLDAATKDIAYVYSQMRIFGATTGLLRARPYSIRALLYRNYVSSDTLYRKSVLMEVGGFADEMTDAYEDWDIHLSMAEKGYRGLFIPEPLVNWRRHSDGSRNEIDPALSNQIRKRVYERHPRLFTSQVIRRLSIERCVREEILNRFYVAWGYIRRGELRTFARRIVRK